MVRRQLVAKWRDWGKVGGMQRVFRIEWAVCALLVGGLPSCGVKPTEEPVGEEQAPEPKSEAKPMEKETVKNVLRSPKVGEPVAGKVAVVYSREYRIRLGGMEKLHPFDIGKYDKIYGQLAEDGLVSPAQIYVPSALTDEQVKLVHTAGFLESLHSSRTVARYLEAPTLGVLPRAMLANGVLEPLRTGAGGTLVATEAALKHGIGINLAGGYHHAKPEVGEGFCVFADIPIAIRSLRGEGKIGRALVVDLDVHQGNGTIVCLQDDRESYTFSIHQDDIYPIPKEKGDHDVAIAGGTGDASYLALLKVELKKALETSKPGIVFMVAGCDTLEGDPLASCTMTPEGVAQRDFHVVQECRKRGLPVVMTLGGGYSKQAWRAQYLSVRKILEAAKNGTL